MGAASEAEPQFETGSSHLRGAGGQAVIRAVQRCAEIGDAHNVKDVVGFGAHLEPGAVLMPGFVNIGARVGAGTMVDTWATVGSCAQVGANVHLAGGVGIGGVLEPPGARPNIIEDGCFVGSRCILVEGVLVEEHARVAGTIGYEIATGLVTGPGRAQRIVLP